MRAAGGQEWSELARVVHCEAIAAGYATDCAIREVREDTGLQIRITGLIGTYTDPNIFIAYSDGEVRQEFTFVYAAEIESGELKIDDESKEAAWVPLSSAVELPLAESQRRRLKDVMEYQKERRTFLR
jgi:8-oxo-dGTP diphosphatase